MGETTLNGETSTKFICGPRIFVLVHWLNSWFLLLRY